MNNYKDVGLKAFDKAIGLAEETTLGDVERVVLVALAGGGRRASRVVTRLLIAFAGSTCANCFNWLTAT